MVVMQVTFPGGKRVVARMGDFVIESDQPPRAGGEGSAPAPFDLFLASLANCAGYFLLEFCERRGLSTEGLALRQEVLRDPHSHAVARVRQVVTLPAGFPEKYRGAALRAAASCSIKKFIEDTPPIEQVLEPTGAVP